MMKFIRPIVTDNPMLIRNSRLPYARPSKTTPIKLTIVAIAVVGGARPCRQGLPGSFWSGNLSNSTL